MTGGIWNSGRFLGLSGALLAGLAMVLYPIAATAQDGNAVAAQYNIQDCEPIVEQYNNVVNGGADAVATGDEGEAAAAVANELDLKQSVVINCINGNGNGGGSGGGANAGANNFQNCAPIVNQYNNVVNGGATANGEAAVAEVANKVNATQNVVINCINGNNNNVGDDGDDTNGDTTDETSQRSTASASNTVCDDSDANAVVITNGSFTIADTGPYLVVVDNDEDEDVSFEYSQSASSGSAGEAVTRTGTFESGENRYQLEAGTYTVTDLKDGTIAVYKCVVVGSYNSDKTLANTGGMETISGTTGLLGGSATSAVVIPAGSLLVLSSLAGMVWLVRRPDSR